jgi:hypothetical protein
LNSQISVLDSEIEEYDRDIKKLQDLRATHVTEKNVLLKELQQVQTRVVCGKGKGSASHVGIDYTIDGFDWSEELKVRMKKVFGINSFRLCQQGLVSIFCLCSSPCLHICRVCNANMDGRDIVCVMPTGYPFQMLLFLYVNFTSRRGQILDISTTGSAYTGLYTGGITAYLPYYGPDSTPQRRRR